MLAARNAEHTVEPVVQSSTSTQLSSLDLLRREQDIEQKAEAIPASNAQYSLEIDQPRESWPCNFGLEGRQSMLPAGFIRQGIRREERAGVEERRSRASSHVVAQEAERVARHRQAERDQGCADSGIDPLAGALSRLF